VEMLGLAYSLQNKQEAAKSLPALNKLVHRAEPLQTSRSTEHIMRSELVMWPLQPNGFS